MGNVPELTPAPASCGSNVPSTRESNQFMSQFLEQLRERLGKFGLSLHPDKTRLIEFGRFAAERRRNRSDGKPDTFDFLGFTRRRGQDRRPFPSNSSDDDEADASNAERDSGNAPPTQG